jgi:glycosyltransferase involved in cell wall biosynthesis
MEALAAGLPLVVTDVGGIAAAVTDGVNGRLVRPGRPDEFAAALLDVARDADARTRMGVAAYTEGRRFDIRRAVGRIEQVYLDLVEARRGAGSVVEHVA